MANRLRWRSTVLAVGVILAACGPSSVQPGVGARLPDIALSGLTVEAPISTEALRGTPHVINFWATWCGPCRQEMSGLERISHPLAAQGVRVIGVTVDQDLNLAREFVRANKLTFPMYADGATKPFQSALRVGALPETVLVAADGTIAARILGARDWNAGESHRLLEHAFNLRLEPGR
jgi:thiol-disulfide isomerase/thioredoxin